LSCRLHRSELSWPHGLARQESHLAALTPPSKIAKRAVKANDWSTAVLAM
jgi:hypothetical protein